MDWTTWITWTAQAVLWAVLALFFYVIVLRVYGVEKLDRNIADTALWETTQARRTAREKGNN